MSLGACLESRTSESAGGSAKGRDPSARGLDFVVSNRSHKHDRGLLQNTTGLLSVRSA
jgi:hypothetical protein